MACEVMNNHQESPDADGLSEMDELRRQIEELNNQKRELEQVIEKLREENADLRKASTLRPIEAIGAPPPPPPPPPPPIGFMPPPLTQVLKERRSIPKKPTEEGKKDESDSKQNQLIMEVVNFLKSGGLTKSKRQRSMTQPDLSVDLAKYKESRKEKVDKKDVDGFRSLKARTEKGESLAKELDALKASFKENVSSLCSSLGTPNSSRRGSYSKSNSTGANGQSSSSAQTMKNSASVSDLRSRLELTSKNEAIEETSRIQDKFIAAKQTSPTENPFTSHKCSTADNDTMEQRAPAGEVEVQEAHITFESDRSSQNSDANMRAHSRSSGIASSLLSDRLSELSFHSDTESRDDEVAVKAKCASPKIIITPVDDIVQNPMDAVFNTEDVFNLNDSLKPSKDQQVNKYRQEISTSVDTANASLNLVTVNGLRIPSTTIQLQSTLPTSTRNKQRFWEQAVATNTKPSRNPAGGRSPAPSGSRSPTLEKFRDAAWTTVERQTHAKLNASRASPTVSRQTIQSSPGSVKSNHSFGSPATSTMPLKISKLSPGISKQAAANINKFRT